MYFTVIKDVTGTANNLNIPIGTRPGCPSPCNVQFGTGFFNVPNLFLDRQITFRIDHKLGENDQLSGNYAFSDQDGSLSTINFPGLQTSNLNTYQNLQISETHIFSSRWTNEARIAYNRILIDFPNNVADALGNTLPVYSIAQVSPLGVQTNIPQGRVANNYLVQDTVTHIRGNHTFRFGFDFLHQRSRQFAPIVERGQITYVASVATTGTNAVPAFSGFANFIDDFSGTNRQRTH